MDETVSIRLVSSDRWAEGQGLVYDQVVDLGPVSTIWTVTGNDRESGPTPTVGAHTHEENPKVVGTRTRSREDKQNKTVNGRWKEVLS